MAQRTSMIYISSYPFDVEQEERTNPAWAFRGRHV
jgi:hypothetical protein